MESDHYAAKRLQIWSLHPEPSRVIWAIHHSKQSLFETKAPFYMWPWEKMFWPIRVKLSEQNQLIDIQMIANWHKFINIPVEKRISKWVSGYRAKCLEIIIQGQQRHLAGTAFSSSFSALEVVAHVFHKIVLLNVYDSAMQSYLCFATITVLYNSA